MDSWVRFSAQTQAKDKLFRTAQYACMLLGYTIQKGGAGNDLLTKVRQLEAHISLGRKLLRLGNSADALETAKRTVHLSDGVLRLCLTVAHLNRAMYFVCDNVLWAGKTGLLPKLDQNKWSQRSFRYYLFALILSLTRDAYEVSLLMKRESRNEAGGGSKGAQWPAVSGEQWDLPQAAGTGAPGGTLLPACLHRELVLLAAVLRGNPPLLLDLLKNLCDLFIPLDRLGLYQTGNGFVGACGLASSLLSLLTVVHPWLKLKP